MEAERVLREEEQEEQLVVAGCRRRSLRALSWAKTKVRGAFLESARRQGGSSRELILREGARANISPVRGRRPLRRPATTAAVIAQLRATVIVEGATFRLCRLYLDRTRSEGSYRLLRSRRRSTNGQSIRLLRRLCRRVLQLFRCLLLPLRRMRLPAPRLRRRGRHRLRLYLDLPIQLHLDPCRPPFN